MNKEDLLKILLEEREYHASHPGDVATKFFYALGGTLTTIIVGFLFKDKIEILKQLIENPFCKFSGTLIIFGYILIMYALNEHTKIHKLQLVRLENAIQYLLYPNIEYKYTDFWEKFGEVKFGINTAKDDLVKLITKEPDTRQGIRFHDKKIEIGIYIILVGCIILMAILLSLSAKDLVIG